jgi:hypothetical protein
VNLILLYKLQETAAMVVENSFYFTHHKFSVKSEIESKVSIINT